MLLARRIRYGYSFRKIQLTRGKFAIVDPADYYRLAAYKWHALKGAKTFYAGRFGSRAKGRKAKFYQMHRQIIHIPDGMVCDHVNGKGLDNRKANLRAVTLAQNRWNSPKSRARSRSRFKGLAWDKKDKRWEVRICVNGRRIYIGRFKDELTAARAYDKAATEYHGQYASLNFDGA